MAYAYTFLKGILIGFLAGILVYRRHAEKLKSAEDKGKSIIDALKGR